MNREWTSVVDGEDVGETRTNVSREGECLSRGDVGEDVVSRSRECRRFRLRFVVRRVSATILAEERRNGTYVYFSGFARVVDGDRVDERDERDSDGDAFHHFETRGAETTWNGVEGPGKEVERANESKGGRGEVERLNSSEYG